MLGMKWSARLRGRWTILVQNFLKAGNHGSMYMYDLTSARQACLDTPIILTQEWTSSLKRCLTGTRRAENADEVLIKT